MSDPAREQSRSWFNLTNASSDVANLDIYGEIGEFGVSSADFRAALRTIKAKTIEVHVNSPGGFVDEGIAIYTSLKDHPARVEMFIDAAAYSIATVIAQAGDRIVMAPHSRMAIHNAMAMGGGITLGYADDFERFAAEATKVANDLRDTSRTIAGVYAERTGKDVDFWLDEMAAERRYAAEQAVEVGLADEVGRATNLEAFRIAANFNIKGFREANELKAEIEAEAEAVAEAAIQPSSEPEDAQETPPEGSVEPVSAPDEPNAEDSAGEQSNRLSRRDERHMAVDRVLEELGV